MKSFVFSIVAGISALVLVCPNVRADEWNKKTVFTFSGPVEVPGKVLPAGSYVFKLADSQSDRHIVQVFNTRENHLYGTFLTIPEYRAKTPDKPIIVFEERAADSPQAIKAWFYPGDNYGDEFIYPKVKATEMAYVNNPPAAPASPTATEENGEQAETLSEPPASATEQPQANREEQETAQVTPPAQQDQSSATAPTESNPSETAPSENSPEQLPKTASPLPLIGLIGLLSLGAGCSLRVLGNRIG